MSSPKSRRPQLVFLLVLSSVLTHALGQAVPTSAASTNPTESASQTQPLWSYQVKPGGYMNQQSPQQNHYTAMPSIFDAFNGLSQRQGALTSSPFLSILPIILIAAGGMLLLLPFLTMMMASPFSGFGGGFNNGFGYPQVGALNKKRSLNQDSPLFGQRNGLVDLFEHVTNTIEELSKRYSNSPNKKAKSVNANSYSATGDAQSAQSSAQQQHQTPNHKSIVDDANGLGSAASIPNST